MLIDLITILIFSREMHQIRQKERKRERSVGVGLVVGVGGVGDASVIAIIIAEQTLSRICYLERNIWDGIHQSQAA
jgi:hypothetical protein